MASIALGLTHGNFGTILPGMATITFGTLKFTKRFGGGWFAA